jgi:hypothetical protein
MNQISPPIRILLVAVIGLCAAYMLFLRPKPEATTGVAAPPAVATTVPAKDPNAKTSSGSGAIVQNAIKKTTSASDQAKVAAGETPGGLAADGTTGAATTGSGVAAGTTPTVATATSPVTKETLSHLPKDVRGAVAKHKVIVLLFYNNRSADDRAVRRALSHVSTYGGQVFLAPHWIKSVARYQSITRGVDVEQSPTIVVADRNLKAETLVGYVDAKTIDQTVVDALLASGGSLITSPYFRKIDALCTSMQTQIRALAAPATAALIPAYLTGVQGVTHAMATDTAAIKPAKNHRAFHKRFVRYTAANARIVDVELEYAKIGPKTAAKAPGLVVKESTKVDKKFVAKNGAHGLSCF